MKKWLVILSLLLVGCSTMKNYSRQGPPGEDLSRTRELKLLALIDKNDEPRLREYEQTLATAFREFEKEVGITAGTVNVELVNLDGVRSMDQVYRFLFCNICPRGPKAQDVTLLYTSKIFAEDLAGLLMAGSVKLGGCELVFRRFVVLRTLSVSLVRHEMGHVFGADDRKYPDDNRQIILSMKDRRFDGWYMRNWKKEIPVLKDAPNKTEEEVVLTR
jgi:hypothetical protein